MLRMNCSDLVQRVRILAKVSCDFSGGGPVVLFVLDGDEASECLGVQLKCTAEL